MCIYIQILTWILLVFYVYAHIGYWKAKGVVREYIDEGETFYAVIESQESNATKDKSGEANSFSNDGTDSGYSMQLASDAQEKQNLLSIEVYIKGMISNQETVSLERIHSLLKLIASGGGGSSEVKYDMNMMQLHRFLQKMIDANKIDLVDGLYRAVKKV